MSSTEAPKPATVRRLGNHIFLFRSPAGLNSYGVSDGNGWTLIDPWNGVDVTAREVLANPPQRILLTHFQKEHADGCLAYPDVPVTMPEADFYLARGEEAVRSMIAEWQPPWDWNDRGLFRGNLAGALNERPLLIPAQRLVALEKARLAPVLHHIPTPGHGKNAVTFLYDAPDLGLVGFPGDLVKDNGTLVNWYDCDWDYGALTGQKTLLESARHLLGLGCQMLCPAHGEPVADPAAALRTLIERVKACSSPPFDPGGTINFPERAAAVPGFREILPGLLHHQTGNCAVLISPRTGEAVMVDAGPSDWVPVPQRKVRFLALLHDMRQAYGISRFGWLIPTHYHGDHTEGIPWIVEKFGAEVIATAGLARVLESPEKYDIACPLWWYGTGASRIKCDRRVPEGAKLKLGDFELTFFHLGGQTRHHLGVFTEVEGRRIVFCGDAVSGTGTDCDPVLTYNDADPATEGWLFALRKLSRLNPDYLIAGHGIAIAEPRDWLDAKLRNWRWRMADFRQLSGGTRGFFVPPSVRKRR